MSESDWEKADEKVNNEVDDILCGDEEACTDFVTWLAEEKTVHFDSLVQEWIKTKGGADWVYYWVETAYEAGKDSDNLGGER